MRLNKLAADALVVPLAKEKKRRGSRLLGATRDQLLPRAPGVRFQHLPANKDIGVAVLSWTVHNNIWNELQCCLFWKTRGINKPNRLCHYRHGAWAIIKSSTLGWIFFFRWECHACCCTISTWTHTAICPKGMIKVLALSWKKFGGYLSYKPSQLNLLLDVRYFQCNMDMVPTIHFPRQNGWDKT